MDDLLLPDPGAMAGITANSDSYQPANLPALTLNTLTPPTTMADDLSGLSDPSAQSASAGDISTPSSYDWGNFLGGLAGNAETFGLKLGTYDLIQAPAAQAQAQNQQQLQQNALQAQLAGLTPQLNSGSFVTILVWGLIAWAVVSLIEK